VFVAWEDTPVGAHSGHKMFVINTQHRGTISHTLQIFETVKPTFVTEILREKIWCCPSKEEAVLQMESHQNDE